MTKRRVSVPVIMQTKLLLQSGRRCALCFGLNGDIKVKEGQIAHLDHDPSNNNLDNLTWLCLFHHDQYDSIHRQAKGIEIQEVKAYRTRLYSQASTLRLQNVGDQGKQSDQIRSEQILELLDRYSHINETTTVEITTEILSRVDLIHQFTLLDEEVTRALENRGIKDDRGDAHYDQLEKLVQQKLKYPDALEELQTAHHLWPSWKEEVENTVKAWASGSMSDEGYEYTLQIFEEGYELDLIFILFGFRAHDLSPAQVRALWRFSSEFGQREYYRQLRSKSEDIPI